MIENSVWKYTEFLILGDARLLLLNRIVPVIPFVGAFIAISGQSPSKCVYIKSAGCILKYDAILILGEFSYGGLGSGNADIFMLAMVCIVIVLSMAIFSSIIKNAIWKISLIISVK